MVGTRGGTLILKSVENLWDNDIKKVGVSHAHQNACIPRAIHLLRRHKFRDYNFRLSPSPFVRISIFVAIFEPLPFDANVINGSPLITSSVPIGGSAIRGVL